MLSIFAVSANDSEDDEEADGFPHEASADALTPTNNANKPFNQCFFCIVNMLPKEFDNTFIVFPNIV